MSSYNHQQSSATNNNRFRSFMSTTSTQQQGIYNPRTLSGSETDVSTSNENLSNEDRYVIRHTARQEPQGQENFQLQVYSNSNRNSQRESSSSYNTLIIHSLGDDTWSGRNSGTKDSPDNLSLYNAALGHPTNSNISVGVYDSTSGATKRLSQGSNCSMAGGTTGGALGGRMSSSGGGGNHQVQEITDIPDDYLNQSSVLKHLAKEATTKSPVYSIVDHVVHNSSGDVADYGGILNQTPQKQQQHNTGHLLYNNNGSCSSPSPTSTLLTSPQQQYNRPSSATNTHRSTIGKNSLSKSQPDLSRTDIDDTTPYNNNNNNSTASVAVGTQDSPATNIAITPVLKQQQQQQQHYSAPVLMRNSSGGGNTGVLYGGVGVGPLRYRRDVSMPRPRTRGRDALDIVLSGGAEPFPRDKSGAGNETWSADMIDMLLKENSALKLEVENCYARIGKSQKLEQEVLKVHSAHEDLVASCERRERLERTARTKLQLECRRLQDTNRLLRDQLDIQQVQLIAAATAAAAGGSAGVQQSCSSDADDNAAAVEYMRREMTKRDLLIAQFITQNKELGATKERQEIELTAQRATLQEQRTHIDILESALTNAQGNIVRLEDECRKKHAYVERVGQLQRALSAMQIANDRREQTERSLRLQLELELERTNNQSNNSGNTGASNSNDTNRGASSGGIGTNTIDQQHIGDEQLVAADLKRQLREREEKLMRLEGECSKWEQRYLEESALRQAAIDAASIPKDAKIAALEKTSQETEKIIAEARTDKMRHMDKAHAAQKKLADLESRLKDLESKLAERDAMIRVLNQKHTHTAHYSPHHTPHSSSTASDHLVDHHVLSSREELVSSVLTGSTGFGSGNSYSGSDSSFAASLQAVVGGYGGGGNSSSATFDATKKTLDNQIKEIDSQLDTQMLTKRALCCFPGFANPIAAARKGKLPKPLLAGLVQRQSPPPPSVIAHKKQAAAVAAPHNTNRPPQRANCSSNADAVSAVSSTSSYGGGGSVDTASLYQLLPPAPNHPSNNTSEILLLEKQGRSSQQQRMSDSSNVNLPPSSLPRPPPRSIAAYQQAVAPPHGVGAHNKSSLRYNRLNNDDTFACGTRGKKSDGADSMTGQLNTVNTTPSPRSMIPSPSANRSRLEYARLVSSDSVNGSTVSLRKAASSFPRGTRFGGGPVDRDSTLSDNSASSLPISGGTTVRFYSGPSGGHVSSVGSIGAGTSALARRGSSLGRDSKGNCSAVATATATDATSAGVGHTNQYRIQF